MEMVVNYGYLDQVLVLNSGEHRHLSCKPFVSLLELLRCLSFVDDFNGDILFLVPVGSEEMVSEVST